MNFNLIAISVGHRRRESEREGGGGGIAGISGNAFIWLPCRNI